MPLAGKGEGAAVWDIVRVPFPHTDRPVRQHRPALVIAAPDAGDNPLLLWVLMITSARNRGWPGDVAIVDLRAAGLPAPSLIRTSKIATIDAHTAEPMGRLAIDGQRAVTSELKRILPTAAQDG